MQKSRDPALLAESLSAWIRERAERGGSAGVVSGELTPIPVPG